MKIVLFFRLRVQFTRCESTVAKSRPEFETVYIVTATNVEFFVIKWSVRWRVRAFQLVSSSHWPMEHLIYPSDVGHHPAACFVHRGFAGWRRVQQDTSILSSQVHEWRCRSANSNFQFYHILYSNHCSETDVFELYLNHILHSQKSASVCNHD